MHQPRNHISLFWYAFAAQRPKSRRARSPLISVLSRLENINDHLFRRTGFSAIINFTMLGRSLRSQLIAVFEIESIRNW
jgi:hypothetical protein